MMNFSDGNITDLVESRNLECPSDINHHRLQMHSSLIRRLSLERELKGHECCVTSVDWNSNGSLLMSGSMDAQFVLSVGDSAMKYTAEDVSKQYSLYPMPNSIRRGSNASPRLNKCKKLVQAAEISLDGGTNYLNGIEACSEVLDGNVPEIGPELRHECLCIRAALFLKRRWINDVHMAIRDCKSARSIDSSSFMAYYHMSEALLQLGKHEEALAYAVAAQGLDPLNSDVAERVKSIKNHLAAGCLLDIYAAEAEKCDKENDGQPQAEARPGRVRLLSDIQYQSELNSDASVDGPRSEGEGSDFGEEMELDLDEGQDIESSIRGGNLRLRWRGESARDATAANGSFGSSLASSSQNDNTAYQSEAAIDMNQRYVGHCSANTGLQQASFLGQRGEYVASGSDDGRWFIWEKLTGRLIKMLDGDCSAVNCVQCHPSDCAVATCGDDSSIKIWTPTAQIPSIVAGGASGPEIADVFSTMELNQQTMRRRRQMLLFDLLKLTCSNALKLAFIRSFTVFITLFSCVFSLGIHQCIIFVFCISFNFHKTTVFKPA